jgi:hypothetical protein
MKAQGVPNMPENKTFVIKYDDTVERFLKASTAVPYQTIPNCSFHLRGNVQVTILGENKNIVIPDINESFFLFTWDQFREAKLYLAPTNYWRKLDTCIKIIDEMQGILSQMSQLAIREETFDRKLLTDAYFEKKDGAVIKLYELEHYKILFILKKFHVPPEIIPHEGNYFQLYFRISNINN